MLSARNTVRESPRARSLDSVDSSQLGKHAVARLAFQSKILQGDGFCCHAIEKLPQIILNRWRNLGGELGVDDREQPEYVVLVLLDVLGVDRVAIGFPLSQIQPRPGLQGDQVLRSDDGNATHHSPSGQKELVVAPLQQDR